MLNARATSNRLTHALQELGLQATLHQHPSRPRPMSYDADLDLTRGTSHQRYQLDLRETLKASEVRKLSHLAQSTSPVILGVASAITPQTATALHAAGIQYVDSVGNAWIQFGDVLIDVRGRRAVEETTPRRPSNSSNLFSSARAQVIFALLQWPRLWRDSQRAVADAAGVSLGQAHSALTMLDVLGFGPGGHRPDVHLLDLWVTAFPTGLGEKLALGRYRGSATDLNTVRAEDTVFTSGEPLATELVHPHRLVIYVDDLDPMLPVVNRWRSDGEPNIIVRRKFWTTPPHESHDYDGPMTGLRAAPAVLVYADLISSDDPRVREVAEEWRKRIARPDLPA